MVATARPLGEVNSPPRQHQRGGLVLADALALRGLVPADHRGVGGVALRDLNSSAVRAHLIMAKGCTYRRSSTASGCSASLVTISRRLLRHLLIADMADILAPYEIDHVLADIPRAIADTL